MATLDKDSMAKLMELNTKITRKTDFATKIQIISDAIKDIAKADRCSIFIHDNKSNSFWTIHSDGISYIELPDTKGIISDVFITKKTIIDNNLSDTKHAIKSIDAQYITKSIISMPILGFDDECIGVVQLLNKYNDEGFNDTDKRTLQFVVNHFTTFIQMIVQEHN